MPGGAAARVVDRVDEIANLIEGLDVFGVLSEGEFDLGLFGDGVDAAQPVWLGVGQRFEATERVIEIPSASLLAQRRCDFSAARIA